MKEFIRELLNKTIYARCKHELTEEDFGCNKFEQKEKINE